MCVCVNYFLCEFLTTFLATSYVFTCLTLDLPDILLPVLWFLHDICLLPSSPGHSLENYGPLRCHRMVVLNRLVLTILFHPCFYAYSSQFCLHPTFLSHHVILQTPFKIFVTSFYFSACYICALYPTYPNFWHQYCKWTVNPVAYLHTISTFSGQLTLLGL